MISTLLHAQNPEPGRRLGKKFGPPDYRLAWSFQVAAGNLRRDCEEELINKTGRHKLSEQRGTSFVKQETQPFVMRRNLRIAAGATRRSESSRTVTSVVRLR